MNKSRFFIILLAVGLAVVVLFLMGRKELVHAQKPMPQSTPPPLPFSSAATPTPNPAAPPPANVIAAVKATHAEQMKKEDSIINAWILTPITFYGKIVDEKGNPVMGAKVTISAGDHPFAGGSKYERSSDDKGFFSITGIHGIAVVIMTSKKGYYTIPQSSGTFSYAAISNNDLPPHPDPSNPAIFVLRKMGKTEPLIMQGFRRAVAAKDGTPTNLDFQTGKKTAGTDSVQIQIWTQDAGMPKNGVNPFAWKASISVSGGGLLPRTGDAYNFQAPTDGYASEKVVDMQPNDPRWSTRVTKEYWFHFADGRYARATIGFFIGGFQFVNVTCYLNPQPGHTNLEYNPDQTTPKTSSP